MESSPGRIALIAFTLACGPIVEDGTAQRVEFVREVGGTDGDQALFRVADLTIGTGGQLMVLDEGAKAVLVFDPKGALLRRFGREGEGPGEFLSPNRIRVHGDTILVTDWWQSRLTSFSREGEVLNTTPLPGSFSSPVSSVYRMADGSVLATSTFTASPGSAGHDASIHVMRRTDSGVDTLLSFEPGYVMWRSRDGSGYGVVPEHLGKTGAVAVSGDSAAAFIDGASAQLQVVLVSENAFRFLSPVQIPISVREVPDDVLRRLRERLLADMPQLPTTTELIAPSATSSLTGNSFFDDAGAVWIETRSEGGEGERRWMVIARRPNRSRWVSVPTNLQVMRVEDDHAYGVWTDSLDVQTVRIYRLH